MRDLIDMWANTRMVVLTAMTASLYAAILIPFKVLPIIPGVTEFRPANAVPVVCSFLFGPAAAWGSGIGNVIGDFFGGIGPGAFFGFVGNFLYGFLPYKIWEIVSADDPVPAWHGRWSQYLLDAAWLKLLGVILLAAAACALVIGWGLNLLGFVPFAVLANIILVNNVVIAFALAPLLLSVLYPRVKRGGLLYKHVMSGRSQPGRTRGLVAVALVSVSTLGGLVIGNLLSTGSGPAALFLGAGAVPGESLSPLDRMALTTIGVTPAVILLVLALLLL